MRLRHLTKTCRFALTGPALAMVLATGSATAQVTDQSQSVAGAYLAARAAELRNDLDVAAAFYNEVYDRNPGNIPLAVNVMSLWIEAGIVEEAVPLAESIIAADPGYEPARLVLAASAIKNGEYELASQHIAAITGNEFSRLSTALLEGWTAAGRGDVDGAIAGLSGGTSTGGLLQSFHAALIADLDGRSDEAISLMASVYDPDQTQRVVEAYARILARADRSIEAEDVIVDFLADVPGHPRLTRLLDEIQSGAEVAPMVTTASEGAAEVFYGLASSLVAADGFQIAISYLQISRYLGPAASLADLLLGQLLQSQGRHNEAVQVLDSVDDNAPFAVTAAVVASISDASAGREEAAIERLRPVVDADPLNVTAVDTLASIYRSESRWQDANDVLSATIDVLPSIDGTHWRLFFSRGISFERMGEWPEAERDFQRALVLSPGEADVLNYLGYSWLEQGINFLEAFDMIEQAVEQRPQSGYIVDSLGWAYYKLGNYEAAVATLERAVELTPNQPDILEHLGDALWRFGRRLEARFQWQHALDYDPDAEDVERLEEKLTNGLPDLPENVPAEGIMEIN